MFIILDELEIRANHEWKYKEATESFQLSSNSKTFNLSSLNSITIICQIKQWINNISSNFHFISLNNILSEIGFYFQCYSVMNSTVDDWLLFSVISSKMFGSKRFRFAVSVLPLWLNNRSTGLELATIAAYSRNFANNLGKSDLFKSRHSSELKPELFTGTGIRCNVVLRIRHQLLYCFHTNRKSSRKLFHSWFQVPMCRPMSMSPFRYKILYSILMHDFLNDLFLVNCFETIHPFA